MIIQFNDREKKIISCIEELTGKTPSIIPEFKPEELQHIKSCYINHILLLASSFHYFQLEDEGRLSSLLKAFSFIPTSSERERTLTV